MKTLLHSTAIWHADASRVRTDVNSRNAVSTGSIVAGGKHAIPAAVFATIRPTRRGAPPQ